MAESIDLSKFSNMDIKNPEDTVKNQDEITVRLNPFGGMQISDTSILNTLDGRTNCPLCSKSRKFFCYTCYVPVTQLNGKLPKVKLPLKVDIIKHRYEIDGKSTSGHARILASDDVNVYEYPDIPDYSTEDNVVLVFPSASSVNINSFFNGDLKYEVKSNFGLPKGHHMGTLLNRRLNDIVVEDDLEKLDTKASKDEFVYTIDNLPIKKAVFIDSTWNQCRGIYKDVRIKSLRSVVIQNRISQFWRHQKKSPRWYLATIEAIHQFLLEVHICSWGLDKSYTGLQHLQLKLDFVPENKIFENYDEKSNDELTKPYNGQYDDLLFFFSYMFDLIHTYYDHDLLKAYKRPMI